MAAATVRARSAGARVDDGADLRLGRLRVEVGDRPGQAGLLPGLEVGARGKLGDQVERAVGAGFADLGG